MLIPFLRRRNIRFHLALSHRLPDRTTLVAPRHRLSDARIPSLAGQGGPRRRSPVHSWPVARGKRRRGREERSGIPRHSQHLRTGAEDCQTAELHPYVLWDRIWETAYRSPGAACGLATDHAGVDRYLRYAVDLCLNSRMPFGCRRPPP